MGFLEQLGEAGIGRVDKEGAAGFDYLLKGIDAIGQRYEQNAMQDMQTRATQSAMRLFSDGVTFDKVGEFQRMFPQINPMTSFKLADEVAQRFETIKMESLGPKLMQGLQDKSIDPNRPDSIAKWANQNNLTTSQAAKIVKTLSDFKGQNPDYWKEQKDSSGRQVYINERTGEPKWAPKDEKEREEPVYRLLPNGGVEEKNVPKSELRGYIEAGWKNAEYKPPPRPDKPDKPDKADMIDLYGPKGEQTKARLGDDRYRSLTQQGFSDIKPSVSQARDLATIEKDYAATLRELNRVESGSVDLIDPGRKQAVADRINEKLSNLRVEYESNGGRLGRLGLKEEPKASPAPTAITDMLKSSRGAAVPGESGAASQFVMGKEYTNPKTGQVGIWNGKEMVPIK